MCVFDFAKKMNTGEDREPSLSLSSMNTKVIYDVKDETSLVAVQKKEMCV